MAKPGSERILVVDDSPDTLEVLERNLSLQGYVVETAPGVAEAARVLATSPFDVVVTDLKMPGASGLDLIRHVRENFKFIEVLMITGYPSVESAIQAVKIGAEDYLAKPFTDEELLAAVTRAVEKLHARRALAVGSDGPPISSGGLVGESEAIRRVVAAVEKVAGTSLPVLVAGEPGTGKTAVAHAIHEGSERGREPFLRIDCDALAGASSLFALAGNGQGGAMSLPGPGSCGTLYLHHIDELSHGDQLAILAVISSSVATTGGRHPYEGARVVASALIDSLELTPGAGVSPELRGAFGASLIKIPPLRQRLVDIPLLVSHFSSRWAVRFDRRAPSFSNRAVAALQNHTWPGNVRELDDLVRWLVATSSADTVDVTDLPALMRFSALQEDASMKTLADVESAHIRAVLASVRGNQSRAAEILGIDRKTLREKLKRRTGVV